MARSKRSGASRAGATKSSPRVVSITSAADAQRGKRVVPLIVPPVVSSLSRGKQKKRDGMPVAPANQRALRSAGKGATRPSGEMSVDEDGEGDESREDDTEEELPLSNENMLQAADDDAISRLDPEVFDVSDGGHDVPDIHQVR